jgi:hypothetical protein
MKPIRMAVISAERAEHDAEVNAARTEWLRMHLTDLRDLSALPAEGMYAGVAERSFMVAVPRDEELKVVIGLARVASQESILVLDEDRQARLVYMDGRPDVPLGIMREVSRARAIAAGAYTRVGGVYFLAGDGAPAAAAEPAQTGVTA